MTLPINTILFDLDGTLIDSAVETRIVLNLMRAERGFDPIEDSQFRQLISYGASSLIKIALDPREEDLPGLVDEFRARYSVLKTPPSSIYPTVIETLTVLKERGLKLGVCTNKPDSLCSKVLTDTGLGGYFECIVAGKPSINPKPHQEPVLRAISRLSSDASMTVMIGDSSTDQRAAQSAGIPFIFYTSGYNDGVLEDQAIASIAKMSELLNLDIFMTHAQP